MSDQTDNTQYPKDRSSRSGTSTGYSVEARYTGNDVANINGVIFGSRWKEVQYQESPIGVPRGELYHDTFLAEHNLYGYASAQALRWWFHANASILHGSLCLETRLVKHKIEYQTKAVAISEHANIGGDDRSHVMPDYGIQEDK